MHESVSKRITGVEKRVSYLEKTSDTKVNDLENTVDTNVNVLEKTVDGKLVMMEEKYQQPPATATGTSASCIRKYQQEKTILL